MARLTPAIDATVTCGGVVHALILREIKSRFGRQKMGYLWALIEPTVFVAIFALMFAYGHQTTPSGIPVVQFMITGITPFMLFRNTMSQCMSAIETNRVLLNFPHVSLFDLVLARALLEIATMVVVFFLLLLCAHSLGFKIHVEDPLSVLFALACLAMTGFGLGAILAALVPLIRSVQQVVPLVAGRPLFFLSGLFFTADMLPEGIRNVLLWNPILHMIEWLRSAFFVEFESQHVSIEYAVGAATVIFALGMLMLRALRKRILAAV